MFIEIYKNPYYNERAEISKSNKKFVFKHKRSVMADSTRGYADDVWSMLKLVDNNLNLESRLALNIDRILMSDGEISFKIKENFATTFDEISNKYVRLYDLILTKENAFNLSVTVGSNYENTPHLSEGVEKILNGVIAMGYFNEENLSDLKTPSPLSMGKDDQKSRGYFLNGRGLA
jgi:hypothetical protein